jgi:cytochrome P450
VTGGGELTPEKVAELVYVRQVVQESMRIYPPVAMVVRQAVAELDIGGARVLAGDNVFVPIYAIHRNAQLWPDPEVFDPERFSPEAVKARHRWAYLPFGAGPRICVGTQFALTEAVLVLARLLRRFRVELSGDGAVMPRGIVTTQPDRDVRFVLSARRDQA